MLTKLKTFLTFVKTNFSAILGSIILVLYAMLKLKDAKISGYQNEINSLTTQKDSDILETKIKQDQSQIDANSSQMNQYNQLLAQLEQKRQQLTTDNLTPQQVTDYWSKP